MAKKAFSSPQEIEQAEQKALEEEQQEEQETREEETSEEEEQQETSEQTSEEEQETEEQEESSSEEETSELDDILSGHSDEPEVETGEEETEETEETETGEYEPLDLDITNEDFEEITTNPERFREFITQVRADAVAEAEEKFDKKLADQTAQLREEILTNIPEVVQKTQERAQSVNQVRQQFFENNPALKDKMGYVRDMTNTVSHQNPDWSAKQVLDEVAKRAHRDLDLSQQAEERERQRDSGPKFAGAGGRRKPGGGADNRGKQEKLLDDTFGNK